MVLQRRVESRAFSAKWESFGFGVKEVDGHDMKKLESVLSKTPFIKTNLVSSSPIP